MGGGIQSSEMLVKCNFPVLPFKKKHVNIFSNQWQLQSFQLAAHLGDKTKVFINDGDPLLKPHSHCLFNTISGWVCPLFPEAYLYLRYVSKIAIFVPETNFCQGYRMGKASKSTQTCKVHKKKCDILKQVHSYTQNLQIP